MKHIISIVVCVLFTWPALVVGYIVAAIKLGFLAGGYMQEGHAEAAMKFFEKRPEKKETSNAS
jgi:hypothetical protein